MLRCHFSSVAPRRPWLWASFVARVGLSAAVAFALFCAGEVHSAQVTLQWDASTGAAGYRVHYGSASGSYTDFVDAGSQTMHTFSNLSDNVTYYFAIKAYSGTSESDFSAEVVFNSPVVPSPSGSNLVLNWSAVAGADHYVVYRSTQSAQFAPSPANAIATVTSPTHTDLAVLGDAGSHFYVIEAVDAAGQTVGILSRAGEVETGLSAGYNLIGYVMDAGWATGQELGESIPNCVNVLRRDAGTGEWVSVAQKVDGTWVNHESVTPGHAYLAFVQAAGTWTQVGSAIGDPQFGLAQGYNLITLPFGFAQQQGIQTGQSLGESIPNCANILSRDTATGKWVSVAQKIRGVWINRGNVAPGQAYIAYTAGSCVWP